MTPQQALNTLAQVVEVYKGTKKEHEILAQALSVLVELAVNEEKKEDKKDEASVG